MYSRDLEERLRSIYRHWCPKVCPPIRDRRIAASGIAFGPCFATRALPSSLVRLRDGQSSPALWTAFSHLLQRECALASGSSTQYPGRS
jgi:hypothetical protein